MISGKGIGNAKQNNGHIWLETRFVSADYNNILRSTVAFYNCILPILQSFHSNSRMKVMNWQIEIVLLNKLDLANVTSILSIKITNSKKGKAFYFSFCIQATSVNFTKAPQSAEFMNINKTAQINFETSNVGTQRGKVTAIGEILCKDAALTHRGHYLEYLKETYLNNVDIPFDTKIRHKDPTGTRGPVLVVDCEYNDATALAEILCNKLNGKENSPDIFISEFGLGAAKLTVPELIRVYGVHHEWMNNIILINFTVTKIIDALRVEYKDDGTETHQLRVGKRVPQ